MPTNRPSTKRPDTWVTPTDPALAAIRAIPPETAATASQSRGPRWSPKTTTAPSAVNARLAAIPDWARNSGIVRSAKKWKAKPLRLSTIAARKSGCRRRSATSRGLKPRASGTRRDPAACAIEPAPKSIAATNAAPKPQTIGSVFELRGDGVLRQQLGRQPGQDRREIDAEHRVVDEVGERQRDGDRVRVGQLDQQDRIRHE